MNIYLWIYFIITNLKSNIMIVDILANTGLYGSISPKLTAAFNYLKNTDLATVAVGKYEILGTDVFAIVSEYQTKNEADAKWEAHEKYADVQYIISGVEKMGYAPIASMKEKEAYNPEKDIVFLEGKGDYITATAGTFIVFFPHDAHQPCVSAGDSSMVKKVVVKVKV
jgi:YhcH/YjgK/YiaL family protein